MAQMVSVTPDNEEVIGGEAVSDQFGQWEEPDEIGPVLATALTSRPSSGEHPP